MSDPFKEYGGGEINEFELESGLPPLLEETKIEEGIGSRAASALQGATFGAGPMLTAAVLAPFQKEGNESFGDTYSRIKDEAKNFYGQAESAHPGARFAGGLAPGLIGGIATSGAKLAGGALGKAAATQVPGRLGAIADVLYGVGARPTSIGSAIGSGIGRGAAQGATEAAIRSEGTPIQRIAQTAVGGGIGGGIGGALGGLIGGGGRMLNPENLKWLARNQAVRSAGVAPKELSKILGDKGMDDLGDYALEQLSVAKPENRQAFQSYLQELADTVNSRRQGIVDTVDKAAEVTQQGGVKLYPVLEQLKQEAEDRAANELSYPRAMRKSVSILEDITNKNPLGQSVKGVTATKREFANELQKNAIQKNMGQINKGAYEAGADTYHAIKDAENNYVDALIDQIRKAKKDSALAPFRKEVKGVKPGTYADTKKELAKLISLGRTIAEDKARANSNYAEGIGGRIAAAQSITDVLNNGASSVEQIAQTGATAKIAGILANIADSYSSPAIASTADKLSKSKVANTGSAVMEYLNALSQTRPNQMQSAPSAIPTAEDFSAILEAIGAKKKEGGGQ